MAGAIPGSIGSGPLPLAVCTFQAANDRGEAAAANDGHEGIHVRSADP
jgi:hypothetical protein